MSIKVCSHCGRPVRETVGKSGYCKKCIKLARENLSSRINKLIEKADPKIPGVAWEYLTPLQQAQLKHTRPDIFRNKESLPRRIDKFIEKQVKFRSIHEAEQYGAKLPSEAYGKPREPKWGTSAQPKMPKLPKTSGQPKSTLPKSYRPKQPRRGLPTGIASEIGRQLSPKGSYRSVADITEDIGEAGRLAHKITGIKKPSSKTWHRPGEEK